MKKLISTLLVFLTLASCDKKVTDPTGVYVLDRGYASYILTIRHDRRYFLKVVESTGRSSDIQGTWDREKESDQFSLSGVIWENSLPRPGDGIWMIRFEGFGGDKICMEAEGISCFIRKHKS